MGIIASSREKKELGKRIKDHQNKTSHHIGVSQAKMNNIKQGEHRRRGINISKKKRGTI